MRWTSRSHAAAHDLIVREGRRVFIWQRPWGRDYLFDRWSFRRPDGPTAWVPVVHSDGIEINVADDVDLPDTIRIDVAPLRPKRPRVEWGDEIWRARGEAVGGDSGGR